MSVFDKRHFVFKLIDTEGRCGRCGTKNVGAQSDYPNTHLTVWCRACGARATVRVRSKHTAGRIAAAACYALKRQYTAAVAEELMK